MIKHRSNAVQKVSPDEQIPDHVARRRAIIDRISWDNLRLLLVLAESGSFRAAALVAGVSLNTIRTKIDRLERQMGGTLIRRSVEGIALTQDGMELVSIARQMRALGKTAERVQMGAEPDRDRKVKITVTEGLGTFWLVPHLVQFRNRNPGIRVDLHCDMAVPDVLFRDTDIAVQLERPSSPDLIVQRIGTLHLLPFAAENYLREFGMPASLADADNHRLVWQEADQVSSEVLPMFMPAASTAKMIAVTTNTSSAHFWAVAKGAGIGFLPTYVRAVSRSARPIDIGVQLRRDIYLVHHPDAVRFAEVRQALSWLREAFDPARYPWFSDKFIHPDDFEPRFREGNVVKLFEGYDWT